MPVQSATVLPIALIGLSGLGMLLSTETLRRMRGMKGRNDPVFGSSDARVFGFPNAWLSLAYFGALMAFGSLRLAKVPLPIWPALAAAALSIVMTIYLAARLAKLHRF
jgi:uncharacterized membrane protein